MNHFLLLAWKTRITQINVTHQSFIILQIEAKHTTTYQYTVKVIFLAKKNVFFFCPAFSNRLAAESDMYF